ncbi:DUF2288 domain-containing protein [Pannus brasiliensis CCIBt3594]|uniref:DUF2288 domain-containing protein n=1 Tax=Pannus brasiliensis CCIBt3594 TaxID=1427578 RepID=A0AAW9QUE5_9CHRO
MSDIKSQLTEELAEVAWSDLVPHARRDALIVVSESLDLLEVGEAIARDNVPVVQGWIGERLIGKPTTDQLSEWNDRPTSSFNALIVQPFVLIQTL